MLNHFFGICDISGNSEAYSLVQSRLLEEARLLGSQFTVEINNTKRIGLISNNYLPEKASPGKTAALCGDLICPDAEAALNATISIERKELEKSFESLLRSANGTFALVLMSDELWIATDFLGARAVYYGQQDGMMVFGTSFDVIKRILPNKCRLDTQALGEDFSFGYPLGDRTLAEEIKVLRGGHYIQCHRGTINIKQYEAFPAKVPEFETLELSLKESASALKTAILDRIQPVQMQASLLSGGLDSRVIVSELVETGHEVIAANYSLVDTHDRVYAEKFSNVAGVSLHINELKAQHDSLSYGDTTSFSLHAAQAGLPAGKIFSGDGGGELFGFIALDNDLFRKIENLGEIGAKTAMIHQKASRHIAGTKFSNSLAVNCINGLTDELKRIDLDFSAKKIFVAYIICDLRPHLHQYFSSIEPSARELLLPFYDRRVINAAVRIHKIDELRIGHQFYYQLLENLSPLITKTTWQAYPGSLPCPVPDTSNTAISQWDYAQKLNENDARRWAYKLLTSISGMQWPVALKKNRLRGIALVTIARLYNESYVFKQALRINRYFENYLWDHYSLDNKSLEK